jgi:hypothetical protein
MSSEKKMFRLVAEHRFSSLDKIHFYHGTQRGAEAKVEALNAQERDNAVDEKLKSLEHNIKYAADLYRFIEFYKGFSVELKRLLESVSDIPSLETLVERLSYAEEAVKEVRDEEIKPEQIWRWELVWQDEMVIESE